MGVKIKGAAEAKKNLDSLLKNVRTKKAVRAVYMALYIIGADSAVRVPRDTSTLINSQFRDIDIAGAKIFGKVGYSAKYALDVHESKGFALGKHIPRPVGKGEKPGSRGNYWDPSGEPQFLKKAVDATAKQVGDAIRKEMEF